MTPTIMQDGRILAQKALAKTDSIAGLLPRLEPIFAAHVLIFRAQGFLGMKKIDSDFPVGAQTRLA